MISAPFRRPRKTSRIFGALLSLILLAGQTALIAHHHAVRPPAGGRVSLSQQDELGGDANCRLCSLSAQSRAAHAAAAPLVSAVLVVEPVLAAPSAVFGRIAALLPSSRAPPAA